MEDKIKIYIPEKTLDILIKDAEAFKFLKKNGEVNRNDFLNTLIVNYHDVYKEENKVAFEEIKMLINKYGLSIKERELSSITDELMAFIVSRNEEISDKAYKTFSLKPTRYSSDTISFISNYSSNNLALSAYLRNLFISYTNKPRDKREQIIFSKTYKTISSAIKEKTVVHITLKKSGRAGIISPYTIACGKEELFNYVICKDKDRRVSVRLSNIKSAVKLNEPSVFNNQDEEVFDLMIKYGPQFAYVNKEESCFELTERGMELFETFYVHRPIPTRIEGNRYYFECSKSQLKTYFLRLGKEAFPIYPQSLLADMHKHISMTDKYYRNKVKELIKEPLVSDK